MKRVAVKGGEEVELKCVVPDYKGKFRVVVEGMDENGNEVYATALLNEE